MSYDKFLNVMYNEFNKIVEFYQNDFDTIEYTRWWVLNSYAYELLEKAFFKTFNVDEYSWYSDSYYNTKDEEYCEYFSWFLDDIYNKYDKQHLRNYYKYAKIILSG